jgi:hypothetical protein
LQDFLERSFESGRSFANELDFQLQIDDWFDTRANPRVHKTLRCRPIDRLREERSVIAPLPATAPDTDRRWVLRVPPDPYLRFDTCDYSLDPRLVGRRVEARITEREILAVALDTGEIALPPRAQLRQAPHDHRDRARPRTPRAARRAAASPRWRCARLTAMTR